MHQNIAGLVSKADEIAINLDKINKELKNIDVLCFTEHNMIAGDESNLNIPGFKLAASFYRQNRHGGSCILLKNEHSYKKIDEIVPFCISNVIECTAIQLIEHRLFIICIYRPPKNTLNDYDAFLGNLQKIMDKFCLTKNKCVIVGDININIMQTKDTLVKRYQSLMLCYNMKQKIKTVTRPKSGTCLDHLISNIRNSKGEVVELGLSDHSAQILTCPVKKSFLLKSWYTYRRDYCTDNLNKFKESLASLSFQETYSSNCAKEAFNSFYDLFLLIYNLCFPVYKSKVRINRKLNWLTKGIRTCCHRKRSMLLNYRKSKNENDRLNFKNYSKRLRKIIKLTKRAQNDYAISESANKTKAVWRIINENQSNEPVNYINNIIINNNPEHDPKIIVNSFNDYFVDISKSDNINNNVPYKFSSYLKQDNYNSIFMNPTDPQEIHGNIMNLKNTNSTGYDNVCTNIIKSVADVLSPVLSFIVNYCINDGYFPEKLKTTIIMPLHKKDNIEQMSNYRPIAMIPIFSKIIEKVIYSRIYFFLEKYKVLSDQQFGFRKNKNINIAIFDFLKEVMTSIDKKVPVVSMYCDMSKAFDCVNHQI